MRPRPAVHQLPHLAHAGHAFDEDPAPRVEQGEDGGEQLRVAWPDEEVLPILLQAEEKRAGWEGEKLTHREWRCCSRCTGRRREWGQTGGSGRRAAGERCPEAAEGIGCVEKFWAS